MPWKWIGATILLLGLVISLLGPIFLIADSVSEYGWWDGLFSDSPQAKSVQRWVLRVEIGAILLEGVGVLFIIKGVVEEEPVS